MQKNEMIAISPFSEEPLTDSSYMPKVRSSAQSYILFSARGPIYRPESNLVVYGGTIPASLWRQNVRFAKKKGQQLVAVQIQLYWFQGRPCLNPFYVLRCACHRSCFKILFIHICINGTHKYSCNFSLKSIWVKNVWVR